MRAYGAQSMVAPLRRVLVMSPDERFGDADPARWHYRRSPDLARARVEHRELVALLAGSGASIEFHSAQGSTSADAIYTHDPVIVSDAGAILLRMGKTQRRDEPDAIERTLNDLAIPVLGRLDGDAQAEGGDLLWIDPGTLAVGVGSRTNRVGVEQLRGLLSPLGVSLIEVPLPEPDDPAGCLHLMSFVSMVADDLAVVYRPLAPDSFLDALSRRGVECVEVPDDEYPSMGPNVLAFAPRDCLMLDGNPETGRRLEAAGCRIRTYVGMEISLNAEGGPTCLTRPLLRG